MIELLQIEYTNSNFDNNLEKIIYKIYHFLIEFIVYTKIKNKSFMKKSFKAVSLSLFLEYRSFKYNSENLFRFSSVAGKKPALFVIEYLTDELNIKK